MAFETPFILSDNVLIDGTVTVTSEEAGYPKENMWDWLDSTYWKATSAAVQNIVIDKGAAGISVDTLGVLGHNWGTAGNSLGTEVYVQEDDNAGFASPTTMGSKVMADDNPFYLDLTAGTERYNRIRLQRLDEAPYAAVVVLGAKITMPVGPRFTYDPDKQKTYSELFNAHKGRVIYSSRRYSDRMMNVPFRRIPQSFVASDLLPFLEDHYTAMLPFFFVPDPGDHFGTSKVYYLIAPKDPEINLPVYEDDINYRNWTLVAQGYRQSTFR